MNTIVISLIALIPAVLLCWYIYEKDRVEKEPIGLLLLLFSAGAFIFWPVMKGEHFLIGFVDQMFLSKMTFSLSGSVQFESEMWHVLHSAGCALGAIALLEEGLKLLVLYLLTHKNKNFDHLFDGIVYSVFLSLGFAAAENVFYAVRDGWTTFILRSLTSVPGHMIFGVLMGYCYTMWNIYRLAKKYEAEYAAADRVKVEKPFNSAVWMAAAFVATVLLHGFYSFLRFYTSDIMTIVFYAFVILLYVVCFIGIRRLSQADSADEKIAERLLMKKYPNLKA